MPQRLVSVAILVLWTIAATALFTRDILPNLIVGPPPDLRTVTRAEETDKPTTWAILAADPDAPSGERAEMRSVGQLITRSERRRDGYFTMKSEAWVDSGAALQGTPFPSGGDERYLIAGEFEVDPSGNLDHFQASVKTLGSKDDLLTMTGVVRRNDLVVKVRGPLPILHYSKRILYKPREMVQGSFTPLDRLPGLKVGQRWESQFVSPLTGGVEKGTVEVVRKTAIHWDGNPVTTLEVVTKTRSLSARTWVRPADGLVLSQEIPLPFLNLRLDRVPDIDAPLAGGDQRP